MEVNTEKEGSVLIARVDGRIDGVTARDFEDSMKSAFGGHEGNAIVIDFAAVPYISSAGLRSILLLAKDVRARNMQFSLCALTESILEVFVISGFDKIIDIHGDKSAAISAAGS